MGNIFVYKGNYMSNYPAGYVEQESLDEYLERLHSDLNKMRGLLLWSLYHHQGSSSEVGQPIRKYLHIGSNAAMTSVQLYEAKVAGGIING
jgi:hypothetical protein